MTAQYDTIATGYKQIITTLPERRLLEYSQTAYEGDVTGKSILDLACGTGDFTRPYKLRGATRVVGADLSREMIELARQDEAKDPLGIEYIVSDAAELGKVGDFDMVVAFSLLHYAPNRERLLAMCRHIRANLKPGGRFVTININVRMSIEEWGSHVNGWQKYSAAPKPWEGRVMKYGDPMPFRLDWQGAYVQFDIYHLGLSTYEECLREAGFSDVRWHGLRLPPEFEEARPHWQYLLDHPFNLVLECQ